MGIAWGTFCADGDGPGPSNSTAEIRKRALFTCEIVKLFLTQSYEEQDRVSED